MKDRQHLRILAKSWAIRNWYIPGNRDRAIRWFALADKYQD
jgi:hypothetical protein